MGHCPDQILVGGSWNPGALDEIGRSGLIRNEGRHLEFGKGDIGIHMGDTSDVALLVFRNLNKPARIGKMLNGQRRAEVEILDTDVVMSFSNTESIDALMKCLKVIRRSLRASSAQASEATNCHE